MNKTETKIYGRLEDKLKAARVILSNVRLASVNYDLVPAHILPQYLTSFKQFRTDKRSSYTHRDKINRDKVICIIGELTPNFVALERRMHVLDPLGAAFVPSFVTIQYSLYTLVMLRIRIDTITGKVCSIRINLSGEYAETSTTLSRLRMCLQFIKANFSLASYEASRISYAEGCAYWYSVKDKQWINVDNRGYMDGSFIFDNSPLDEDYFILRNSETYIKYVVTDKQIIKKLEHRAFNITYLGE